MGHLLRAVLAAAGLGMLALAPAQAQGNEPVVKVGIVGPFSGPFSGTFGTPFRQGVEAYAAQHGKLAGKVRVEFVYRDLEGPNPEKAKALAQELIVKEKVQYLGGFVFTPNALAVAPLINSAKVPTVIFNASTSMIVTKSDYFLRTSNTLPQVTVPTAKFALEQGVKKVVTAVSDYGPGIDAESSFKAAFEAGGGKVVESIRMPVNASDFGPFMQRVRALKPDVLFGFLPAGPPTFGFVKAYNENGLRADGIRFLATAETVETDLQALGGAAVGLETGYFYSAVHDSPENKAFLNSVAKVSASAVANPYTVSAFDGAHLIYKMIEAAGAEKNPAKAMEAVKGLAWNSPRGPVRIDAGTRDIVQNVYMRRVDRDAAGKLVNREFKTYEMQRDYGRDGGGKS